MIRREGPAAPELHRNRQTVAFGKGDHRIARFTTPVAAAKDRDRFLRLGQARGQAVHPGGRGGHLDRFGLGGVGHIGGFDQHVLGQCDDHRAGATLCGDAEGAGDQFRDAGGVVDLEGPFRHGAEDLTVIKLLKGLAIGHVAADLADEQDHRRAVLHRHMHACRRIGRTGAAGDKADAGPAGHLAIGLGHHGGTALLPAGQKIHAGPD